jgi:hypothetical protein
MKLGMFMMPNHPPHRSYADAHAHNLDTLGFADRMGYVEGWSASISPPSANRFRAPIS